MHVTKVGLQAQFIATRPGRRPTRTFTLSHPNSCSLRHDGRDGLLRQMLVDSGIEPLAPLDRAA
jgi:hypothetical protein